MAQGNSCFAQFFYRIHEDKTVESICAFCFVNSGPAPNLEGLRPWEKAHLCPERKQASIMPGADRQKRLPVNTPGVPRPMLHLP